jgi:predicted O-methyltransferase YrrM
MCELIRLFEPHTYVEIGVKKGHTFNVISPLVKRAVAVDINEMSTIVARPNVEICRMTSLEFARQWNDPIDLLFIDADHRKESVLADFDALSPFVQEGTGLILLHDTYPAAEYLLADGYCSNAWEAAFEIRKKRKYSDFEIVTLPGPYAGLSIIRKAKRHLAWQ